MIEARTLGAENYYYTVRTLGLENMPPPLCSSNSGRQKTTKAHTLGTRKLSKLVLWALKTIKTIKARELRALENLLQTSVELCALKTIITACTLGLENMLYSSNFGRWKICSTVRTLGAPRGISSGSSRPRPPPPPPSAADRPTPHSPAKGPTGPSAGGGTCLGRGPHPPHCRCTPPPGIGAKQLSWCLGDCTGSWRRER
mmetsp:Transcript_1429/g.2475  ORF Transcript_1429/g.2475 Transcript_1429/m.2475 type:complete len:200 (-) Transcript_1429:511-1110(-)